MIDTLYSKQKASLGPLAWATRSERIINLVGLLASIMAGAAQPLMNIPFGQVRQTNHATCSHASRVDELKLNCLGRLLIDLFPLWIPRSTTTYETVPTRKSSTFSILRLPLLLELTSLWQHG